MPGDISPKLRELLEYMNNTQAYPVVESKNDLIRKLDAAVSETKMTPVWRDAYMMYQMKMREVEIRSEAKGRAEGRAEGEAKGRAEGRAEGRDEKAIEVAKKMLLKTMPDSLIAELSGLSISEINTLKDQVKGQIPGI